MTYVHQDILNPNYLLDTQLSEHVCRDICMEKIQENVMLPPCGYARWLNTYSNPYTRESLAVCLSEFIVSESCNYEMHQFAAGPLQRIIKDAQNEQAEVEMTLRISPIVEEDDPAKETVIAEENKTAMYANIQKAPHQKQDEPEEAEPFARSTTPSLESALFSCRCSEEVKHDIITNLIFFASRKMAAKVMEVLREHKNVLKLNISDSQLFEYLLSLCPNTEIKLETLRKARSRAYLRPNI